MSVLEIRGVRKSFGSVDAVAGVDLDVPHGHLTAVLGPSGCGKTTLLRLIAGFLTIDAGTIRFDETVVASTSRNLPPQQRRVGYVPQEGALFPHLSVRDNVAFGLPRAQRSSTRVEEVLDLVELPHSYLRRSPHELSGGQQQRVALARALAPRPSIVLLDEPFSSLDASLRESTGHAVRRALRAAEATALLVTHDQDEALSLADEVAVMRHGRLVQVASPRVLYRSPADVDVARFVGGANTLPGHLAGGRATCVLGEVGVADLSLDGEQLLVVRPEQLRLSAPADGLATGVVQDVSYYGHDASVRLRVADLDLVCRVEGGQAPDIGERVGVRVTGPVFTLTLPDHVRELLR